MACPICLTEFPVAPRMTKCGHTACYPCFIRYFASEDLATGLSGSSLKFRKCPICWDSIQLSEIKPVRWYSIDNGVDEDNILVASEPREGFDVTMRLFMRRPGTTLVLPRDDYLQMTDRLSEGDVPSHHIPEVLHYAWIVKGSETYMKSESAREISDLERMEKEDESSFGEDPIWTQRAITRIQNTLDTYSDLPFPPFHTPEQSSSRDSPPYFFYQPRSASRYYLASLDVRILKRVFGEYSKFPSAILARVEHITSPQTIDDDIRRRIKYLNHLPTGTQISFLECDWSEIVSREILEGFIPEIDRRRRIRREKMVREEKERENEEKSRKFLKRNVIIEEDDMVSHESSEDVTWVIANAVAGIQVEKEIESTVSPTGGNRTVWGTPRVTSMNPTPIHSAPKEDVVEDVDERSGGVWTQNWEEMLDPTKTQHPSRRKKGKKLILMSNSGQRRT